MDSSSASSSYETLRAMLLQEERYYRVPSFSSHRSNSSINDNGGDDGGRHRKRMTQWCRQVADYCKFSRETVEIAVGYVDRYYYCRAVAENNQPSSSYCSRIGDSSMDDNEKYQLVFLAAMYTAIKVHEREAISPGVASKLSRGRFSSRQIEDAEFELLRALDWHVNPPTAASFARQLVSVLVPGDDDDSDGLLSKQVERHIELSVHESELVSVRKSTIAYCCLQKVLQEEGSLLLPLSQPLVVDADLDDVAAVQGWLAASCSSGETDGGSAASGAPTSKKTSAPAASSPKQVAAGRSFQRRRSSFEESPRSVALC